MIKLSTKRVVGMTVAAVAGTALIFAWLDSPRVHNPKVFGPPAKTQWQPMGARSAGQHNYDVIPEPTTWHAIHVDVANADSVWVWLPLCSSSTG